MGTLTMRALPSMAVLCLLLMPGLARAGSAVKKPGVPPAVEAGANQAPAQKGSVKGTSQIPQTVSQTLAQEVTQDVTIEQIRLILQRYVERRFDGRLGDVQVQVLHPQEPITVPAGLLEARVTVRGLEEGLGRRVFQIALAVDGKPVQTVKVMAEVSATADVVTAARYIKPDETIQAGDLTLARLQLPSVLHDYITDLDEAIGKRTVKPLRPDTPIRTSALAVPFAIKRGDQVTIEVKRGGLLIQASGTTKTGGQLGQSITVTNLDSGKEIRGKVVGPGLVRVGF